MKAAAVFSDNMVLQRERYVRIFGTCTNNEKVITVSVPELLISVRAIIRKGRWEAVLPPMTEQMHPRDSLRSHKEGVPQCGYRRGLAGRRSVQHGV